MDLIKDLNLMRHGLENVGYVLSGNPSTLHNGWRRLIHDVSHMVHKWLRPNMNHHCFQQAELELDMIKYVQFKGWLNGTLKKKKIVLSPEDKKLEEDKTL